MKPFNLEAALAGEPVVTRDGRDVTNLAYFPNVCSEHKIAGVLEECIETFTEEGFFLDFNEESESDLFMKPKKRTVWVNLYIDGSYFKHETQELADRAAWPGRVKRRAGKAFPIEIEE